MAKSLQNSQRIIPWILILLIGWLGTVEAHASERVFKLGDNDSYLVVHEDGSIFGFGGSLDAEGVEEVPGDCGLRKPSEWNLPAELKQRLDHYKAIAVSLDSAQLEGWRATDYETLPSFEDMTSGFDFCDITVIGHSARAKTCAPDCHGDCDEGHDGTTCHAHSFFPQWVYGQKATKIQDFVDCCICEWELDGSECSTGTISPSNCGACAGGCWYLPGITSGGAASCCFYAYPNEIVKLRGKETVRSYGPRYLTIYPGDLGTLDNRVLVKEGARESCDGGTQNGWHYGADAIAWEPDRSVGTHLDGTYATYNWSGSSPSINGGGYTYYCGTLPECTTPPCFE